MCLRDAVHELETYSGSERDMQPAHGNNLLKFFIRRQPARLQLPNQVQSLVHGSN